MTLNFPCFGDLGTPITPYGQREAINYYMIENHFSLLTLRIWYFLLIIFVSQLHLNH